MPAYPPRTAEPVDGTPAREPDTVSYTKPCSTPESMSTLRRQASPSAFEGGCAVGPRIGRIIHQRQSGVADLLTDPTGEEGAALGHRLTGQRSGHDAEQGGRHAAVEHDRGAARRSLGRTQKTNGPGHGVLARPLGDEPIEAPAHAVAPTGLTGIAVAAMTLTDR